MKYSADKKNKIGKLILFLSLSCGLIIGVCKQLDENYKKEKLKRSRLGIAIVREVHYNIGNGGSAYGRFVYSVNKKSYTLKEIGDFRTLDLGDTVSIKYSIEDLSVAEVFDKYYMEKYTHLRNSGTTH